MSETNKKALERLEEQKDIDEKAGTKNHRKVLYSTLRNDDLFVKAQEANDTSLMLKIKNRSLTAEEYAQATEKYGIDHSELMGQTYFEGQSKVAFDESIPNLDVDKERQAQRVMEPKFQEQYAWNYTHMKTLPNGRVEFPNGKIICSFQEHEQAVKDIFGDLKDAIEIRKHFHFGGYKLHIEVNKKIFTSYVDEHGSVEWNDAHQLAEADIMNDYLSNYPDTWSEVEKLVAFEHGCPQLFGERYVIDSSHLSLNLQWYGDGRRFNRSFFCGEFGGLILGGNA